MTHVTAKWLIDLTRARVTALTRLGVTCVTRGGGWRVSKRICISLFVPSAAVSSLRSPAARRGAGRFCISQIVCIRFVTMARRPCTFRQQDVTRALRATVMAGLEVRRLEIDKDGKIVVVTGKPDDTERGANEWDRVQ